LRSIQPKYSQNDEDPNKEQVKKDQWYSIPLLPLTKDHQQGKVEYSRRLSTKSPVSFAALSFLDIVFSSRQVDR
jgi:hypothetical protein